MVTSRFVAGIVGLGLALATAPVRADDASEARLAALEAAVATHVAANDEAALALDVKEAVTAADWAITPATKTRVVAVAEKVLDATREAGTRLTAIRALGEVAAPVAFPPLRRFLTPVTPETVEAAGKMRAAEAVPTFTAIVCASEDPALVDAAVRAIGEVGPTSATVGAPLVETLVGVLKREGPEPTRRTPRWNVLAPLVTDALNRITGQNLASPEDWLLIVEQYRKNLEALFPEPPPVSIAPTSRHVNPELLAQVAAFEAKAAARAGDTAPPDLDAAVALAAQTTDAGVKKRLVDAVGDVLRRTRDDAIARAAVKALGDIGEPAGFAFLAPRLGPWTPAGRSSTLAAVDAAGKARADASVPLLLDLVRHADSGVAVAAMKALSGFGAHKAVREAIVRDLANAVKDLHVAPTVPRPPPCIPWPEGRVVSTRYEAVAPELAPTLNALTGRNLATPDEWLRLVDSTPDLADLFLAR